MSRKNDNEVTEEWLINKGYTKVGDEWHPPKLKSKFIQSLKGNPVVDEEIIEKKEVMKSNQFEYMPKLKWFINGYQVPSKKNSRINFVDKSGKQRSIPSKRYADYKKLTKMQWEVFGREFKKSIEYHKLEFPLNIEMTFIRKTNQLVDYFGPGESVFDLMTDFEWWPDDNRKYGKPFFGDMIVNKNNPGVIIKILMKDNV